MLSVAKIRKFEHTIKQLIEMHADSIGPISIKITLIPDSEPMTYTNKQTALWIPT